MYRDLLSQVRGLVNLDRDDPNMSSTTSPALLPGDLLLLVARFLSLADLANVALTCKHYHTHLVPALYSTITLTTAQQCRDTLMMLYMRLDIARHVRSLIVKFNRSHFSGEQHSVAAAAIRNLAATRVLDALQRFEWIADEIPPYDDMWFALRVGCPQLKFIGASLGFQLPPQTSHLFDFTNLDGFTLALKQRFYVHYNDIMTDDIPTLQNIWDMLAKGSPGLKELIITGESANAEIAIIGGLMKNRWSQLRKLVLGDICIDPPSIPPLTSLNPTHPLVSFLEDHTELKHISLSRHNVPIGCLSRLSRAALSNVTEFAGTLEQLQALPQIHESLTSVTFNHSMRTREFTPPAVIAVLQGLPKLENLEITLVLNTVYDSNSLLRGIVQACPHLKRLVMTCAEKPSFQVESFARAIRGLGKLNELDLTIVRFPGDDAISTGAARIAQNNPHLDTFSLAFLPATPLLQFPFSIPYLAIPRMVNEVGRYTVMCDRHGMPQSLAAVEWKKRVWPWRISSSMTRYIDDLRPSGYPGKGTGPLSLFLERSTAGEEMRVIVFSIGLASLALWGFGGAVLGAY